LGCGPTQGNGIAQEGLQSDVMDDLLDDHLDQIDSFLNRDGEAT
jgi:hypothetical protein